MSKQIRFASCKRMIGSYFCLHNSICKSMIELKKHFMINDDPKEFSFERLWIKTGLDFDVFVQSKCIKKSIIKTRPTIIVKNEDEPFFKYFLDHDQKFIRDIHPFLYTWGGTRIDIASLFASDVLEKRDGKKAIESICDKRLPAIERVKTLIEACTVCLSEEYDRDYVYVDPLRWFAMEIIANILPNAPIEPCTLPICSPSIARILGEQFTLTHIDEYEEDMDPATFNRKIFDKSFMCCVNPYEMFHDIIIRLYLTNNDPETTIKEFVSKNVNEICVINHCECCDPFLLNYLPERIWLMIDEILQRYRDEQLSTK